MPEGKSAPDIWGPISSFLRDTFGEQSAGIILLLVAIALVILVFVFKYHKEIRALLSPVGEVCHWLFRRKAHPGTFTVAVARLEDDAERRNENLIIEALKETEGIDVLATGFRIRLKGESKNHEVGAHKAARKALKLSGAQVLIWGKVLQRQATSVPKLYWESASTNRLDKEHERYEFTGEKILPEELFWEDLAHILHLIVIDEYIGFAAKEGHYMADRLVPFIGQIKGMLSDSTKKGKAWNPETRGRILMILGNSLTTFGEQSGNNVQLKEAIEAYRAALLEWPRHEAPFNWAVIKNDLGNTLMSLGERERGTEHIEQAEKEYRSALLEFKRELMPLQWAGTQNNLGIALLSLGERENKKERYEEAVEAFHAALLKRTRKQTPLKWAMTLSNLGGALLRLGELEKGTKRLEEGIEAMRLALLEWTREKTPLYWAMCQNNLGNALMRVGEREIGTRHLEQAAAVFQIALEEFSKAKMPLQWAGVQNNLGNVFRVLGVRENSSKRYCMALICHLEAWEAAVDAGSLQHVKITTSGIRKDLKITDPIKCELDKEQRKLLERWQETENEKY